MRIDELAEKYGVTKREIDYWTNLKLITPSQEENGYRNYGPENEEEVKVAIMMKASGMKMDLAHLGFFKLIPDDMWEQLVVEKILDERRRISNFYDNALRYARE